MTSVVEVRALDHLRHAWDDLVEQSPLPSPFLRSWWLDACATDQSRYVLAMLGEELLGGAFVCCDRWMGATRVTLDAGGRLSPDHLDVVAPLERRVEVVDALKDWFARLGPCLVEVRGAYHRPAIAAALPGSVHLATLATAPFATLPGDPAAYLRSRPSWLRHTIERASKRLAREHVEYRIGEPDDVARSLDDLRRLHEDRWGPATNFLSSFDRFARAATAGVRCGDVVFHELHGPAGVVASMVVFEVGGRASFYQGGRSTDHRWRSAGTVLMARATAQACESGLREFDLLRGAEPYKEAWATDARDVLRIRAAVGPWSSALMAGLSGRDRAHRIISDVRHRRVRA